MCFLAARFHRKDVLDLQWSTDGAFLVSGSVDNSCIIWDVSKGEEGNEFLAFISQNLILSCTLILCMSFLQVLSIRS